MRALMFAVLLATGCQSRPESGQTSSAKLVESDDDFLQTRSSYQQQARARLERIDQRIDQRIDERGSAASVRLRALRDALATTIERIDEQPESGWDDYRAQVEDAIGNVERELRGL